MRIIARQREPDEVFALDASAWYQVGFVALAGAAAAWRLTQSRALRAGLSSRALRFLSAYSALAVASALWSERPDYTIFRGAEAAIFLVLVVDSAVSMGSESALRAQVAFAGVCAVTWHLLDFSFEESLTQLHNSVAPAASVGVLFLAGRLRSVRWRVAGALLAASFILSTSTASYVAALSGLLVLAISPPRPRLGLAFAGAAAIAMLWWAPEVDVVGWLTRNKTPGSVETVSGRLPVWMWLLEQKLPESPLLGFGFGVGESLARLYNDEQGGLRMTHMHNTLMSGLANLGYTGGILIICFWAGALRAAWHSARTRGNNVPMAALVACAVNSLAVSSIGGPVSLPWIAQVYLVAFLTVFASGHS